MIALEHNNRTTRSLQVRSRIAASTELPAIFGHFLTASTLLSRYSAVIVRQQREKRQCNSVIMTTKLGAGWAKLANRQADHLSSLYLIRTGVLNGILPCGAKARQRRNR